MTKIWYIIFHSLLFVIFTTSSPLNPHLHDNISFHSIVIYYAQVLEALANSNIQIVGQERDGIVLLTRVAYDKVTIEQISRKKKSAY